MMPQVKIADAKSEELERVSHLWLLLAGDEEGSEGSIILNEENRKRWMNFAKKLLEQGRGRVKIAIVEGNPIGFIFYTWSSNPLETHKKFGKIYDLFVMKEYRNRGVGTALLKSAIEDLKTHGVEIICVEVLSKNINAISLYEKFGFREKMLEMRLEVD